MPPTLRCIEAHWPAPAHVQALCTTRTGGDSEAPYASLNLAQHVGDDSTTVDRNRRLLAAALPEGTSVQWLSQVHGTTVVQASPAGACPEADACYSHQAGIACAVLTADCLPVLFCSMAGDRVAAAHAGWRGLLGGVLEATVAALAGAPGQLMAWLGPAIGPAAFEVGPEVREAFLARADSAVAAQTAKCFTPNPARQGHYFADLYTLARLRLRAAGLTRIYGGGHCTCSDAARFFSYRRDGQTGRMASLILIRPG